MAEISRTERNREKEPTEINILCDLELDEADDINPAMVFPRYEMKPKLIGNLTSLSPVTTQASSEKTGSYRKTKTLFSSKLQPVTAKDFEENKFATESVIDHRKSSKRLVLESPPSIRPDPHLYGGMNSRFLDKGRSFDGDVFHRNYDWKHFEESTYGFVSMKLKDFMEYFEYRIFQQKLKNREVDLKSLVSDSSKAYIEMSLDEFKSRYQLSSQSSSTNYITIKPRSILKKTSVERLIKDRSSSNKPALDEEKKQKKVIFSSNYLVLHYSPSPLRAGSTCTGSVTPRRKSAFSNR